MIITDISPQRKGDRVNIFIDHKFAFGLSLELKYNYSLKIGNKINKDFIEDILKAEEGKKAINDALNYLSYRQRSLMEVREKLEEKVYEEVYIKKALDYCKEQNYINDYEFAISFVNDKINLNKLGSYRLKRELRQKGVNDDIIDKVLIEDQEDEYQRALEVAKKRYSSYRNDSNEAIYRKLGGFLQRKGYSFDIVNSILKELIN